VKVTGRGIDPAPYLQDAFLGIAANVLVDTLVAALDPDVRGERVLLRGRRGPLRFPRLAFRLRAAGSERTLSTAAGCGSSAPLPVA
jgi:hypothetical protein